MFPLLDEIVNRQKPEKEKIIFEVGKKKVKFLIDDIQCVLSDNKYTILILRDGREQRCRITFSYIYALLERYNRFLLCNRGILLNMDYIETIHGDSFCLKNQKRFPIRQKDKKNIIEIFQDYQFSKLDQQEVFF